MRLDEDINRIFHIEAARPPDVQDGSVPRGDLSYYRVRFSYGESPREIGNLRPLARFNPPNLALLLQYGIDDFGRIDHKSERIEVIEQRRHVVRSESDSLDAC